MRRKSDKRRRSFAAFKNIRVLPSGYQVCVTREKTEFSKHFAGHSPRSLKMAETYRDLLLGTLPPKRSHAVPKRVLAALKHKQPMVGVSRSPKMYYAVQHRDKNGRIKTRAFSWRETGDEIAAYKAAVAFRKKTLPK
jgi:hypothetical protein